MRLKSIDALRGLDMLVIVGGGWALYELGVLLGGIAGLCGACGNLVRSVGSLAVRWLFLYWLYRMNLFLKI